MTNTEAPSFASLAPFALASAESVLASARTALTDALGDPAYAMQWRAEQLVRAGFRVRVLTVAVDKGADALTVLLATALGDGSLSSGAFSTAVEAAERAEAKAMISEFRAFLNPAVFLARV